MFFFLSPRCITIVLAVFLRIAFGSFQTFVIKDITHLPSQTFQQFFSAYPLFSYLYSPRRPVSIFFFISLPFAPPLEILTIVIIALTRCSSLLVSNTLKLSSYYAKHFKKTSIVSNQCPDRRTDTQRHFFIG